MHVYILFSNIPAGGQAPWTDAICENVEMTKIACHLFIYLFIKPALEKLNVCVVD